MTSRCDSSSAVPAGVGDERPAPGPRRSPTFRLRRRHLRYFAPITALVVGLSGGAFAALETDVVESFGQGVWWSLSLVTTVGFVGPSPVTAAGKVLAAVLMVFGFALLSLTTAAIASLFVREDEEPAERRDAEFEREVLAELRALRAGLDQLERERREAPPFSSSS